jgi:hypothetical protein
MSSCHIQTGKSYQFFGEKRDSSLLKIDTPTKRHGLVETNCMPFCEKHQLESKHKCVRCTVEKREATMLERHGVANALHSAKIKEKKNNTCLEKFGNVVVSKTEGIKNKIKESNLARYGVEYGLQRADIREKGKTTMLDRYGAEHALQNKEIKQKRVETNLEKFGKESPLQNPDILAKRKKTNLERYGTEEVLQLPSIQEKVRQTMTDTYGAANPLQCLTIKAKKDQTCEERYGDKDIMHNPEIFEKVVKNSFKTKEYTLPSGAVITYQGYENVALKELLQTLQESDITNDVKKMPKFMYEFEGKMRRYYPDIYIPSQKRIIEVKFKYTYEKQLEQNQSKKRHVEQDGYQFEFWICDKTSIVERK